MREASRRDATLPRTVTRMVYRILGAGPSGLAAAITLAAAGESAEVFEHRGDCGTRFGGDLQGLENWSDDMDALDELRAAGLTLDFHHAPVAEAVQTNGRAADRLSFARPALYLVKRGTAADTLDQGLKRQALAAGVRIRFRETLPPDEAHIVATGPSGRHVFAIDRGIVFHTDAPDTVVVLLDDETAPKAYAYLLVTGGYGCLCTMLFEDFPSVHLRLARAREILAVRAGVSIHDPRPVGGVGTFGLARSLRSGSALRVGEAAGLQDFLWGFGIRMALRSGVLAARCLLDGRAWEPAVEARFGDALRAGVVNRLLWEGLRHGHYRVLMALFRLGGPYAVMHSFARYNGVQRALFPLARAYAARRYPGVV